MAENDRRRLGVFLAVLLLAVAIVGAASLAWREKKPQNRPPESAEPEKTEAPQPAAEPAKTDARSDFRILQGKWLRADGGYVLEIRRTEGDGRLEAAYFNPSPIRVAQAQAKTDQRLIHVFVELRDQGYPGCTYNLVYDPGNDCLAGTYFQAAMGETYAVVFTRLRQ